MRVIFVMTFISSRLYVFNVIMEVSFSVRYYNEIMNHLPHALP